MLKEKAVNSSTINMLNKTNSLCLIVFSDPKMKAIEKEEKKKTSKTITKINKLILQAINYEL